MGVPLSSADGRRADSISLLRMTIVGFSLLTVATERGLLTAEKGVTGGPAILMGGFSLLTGGSEAKPRTYGARILRETKGTG